MTFFSREFYTKCCTQCQYREQLSNIIVCNQAGDRLLWRVDTASFFGLNMSFWIPDDCPFKLESLLVNDDA